MKDFATRSMMALVAMTMAPAVAGAQEKVEATVSADLVSQYVWRGQDLGSAALQPTLGVAWKGLSLAAWGSLGIVESSDTKELDLTLSYTAGPLTVGLTDYWFTSPNDRYFAYAAHETSHVWEAFASADLRVATVSWYTNIGGNDGVTSSGHRAYSSYVEASAPFRLGGLDWTATLGAVPYATSFYAQASGFTVTRVSLKAAKDIAITPSFSLPLWAAVEANPSTEKAYLVAGITLHP